MKPLLSLLLLLSCCFALRAEDHPGKAVQIHEGTLRVTFHNHSSQYNHIDSVLVIFDRYDRTGAGIVRKIFYPGSDHSISITAIPVGKYFVTFQYLGPHHDRFQKTIKIKSNKRGTMSLRLKECEEYQEENVYIPAEHHDLSNLSIIRLKADTKKPLFRIVN